MQHQRQSVTSHYSLVSLSRSRRQFQFAVLFGFDLPKTQATANGEGWPSRKASTTKSIPSTLTTTIRGLTQRPKNNNPVANRLRLRNRLRIRLAGCLQSPRGVHQWMFRIARAPRLYFGKEIVFELLHARSRSVDHIVGDAGIRGQIAVARHSQSARGGNE